MRMLAVVTAFACGFLISHAALAAGQFDGTYKGRGSLISGRCSPPQGSTYHVVDSHISHTFGGRGQVEADVGPDGKLANAAGAIRTTTAGSITGKTLSMEITTTRCLFHYELTKS
jgi:hypothetical protein